MNKFATYTELSKFSVGHILKYISIDQDPTQMILKPSIVMAFHEGLFYYYEQIRESVISPISYSLIMTSEKDLTKEI